MPDFTFRTFRLLLSALKAQHYTFQTFAQFLRDPAPLAIILRHDVDARKLNSLHAAGLEAEMGISGSFYFRIVPGSYDEEVIRQIAALGHEIGYHYEDLALAGRAGEWEKGRGGEWEKGREGEWVKGGKGDREKGRGGEEELYEMAIRSFERNLEKLRMVVPVETICMHGSPLSKYDNRKLWERYDYRKYGILGEPYFDLDFSKVLYLTDTGRRWDGGRVSVRDKVMERVGEGVKGGLGDSRFHSTFDFIRAADKGQLPDQIMITVHPQRWDDRIVPWTSELILQNLKNVIKRMIAARSRRIKTTNLHADP